jgi:hypothetical protein
LGILIRYCITGGLPLDSPPADSHEAKSVIRGRLRNPGFLWESTKLDVVNNIKELLAKCFLGKGSARPTLVDIGQTILISFTTLTYELNVRAIQPVENDAEEIVEIKARALDKLYRVRDAKAKKQHGVSELLSKSDWERLLNCTTLEVDSVSEYIIGASAWRGLVLANDCKEQFDVGDNRETCLSNAETVG